MKAYTCAFCYTGHEKLSSEVEILMKSKLCLSYHLCCALENFSLEEELAKLKEEHNQHMYRRDRDDQLTDAKSVDDHDGIYSY